jgi:VanZ family protein
MNYRKIYQYWFPVVLWIGFIFWMSTGLFSAHNTYLFFEPILRFFAPSISPKEIIAVHLFLRKLAHVTEYFISGLLLFRAFKNGSDERREWLWALSSLIVIVVIAGGDEFHQSFVITRTPSLIDIGIDVTGGFFAQCLSVLNYRRQRQ